MFARFPLDPSELTDLRAAVVNHILPGYAPKNPFIQRGRVTMAIGSCFAQNIAESLTRTGAEAHLVRIEENGNTPLATNAMISEILSLGSTGDAPIKAAVANLDRAGILADLRAAPLLVFTVGVALQMFQGDKPCFEFNRNATFRMLTAEEVLTSLLSTIDMIRWKNPDIHIALTLSPIPLKMAPEGKSVFGFDCLSKSLLRVGIENAVAQRTNVSYWPSFEMIRWLGGHVGPFFGVNAEDNRHVTPAMLDLIMEIFIERYFRPAAGA